MFGTYNPWLVVLSVVVAVIASYVALDLSSNIAASKGAETARIWLSIAAFSMGSGVWSMHYIGMLAHRLPIPMSFDVRMTLLSLVTPIVTTGMRFISSCAANRASSD